MKKLFFIFLALILGNTSFANSANSITDALVPKLDSSGGDVGDGGNHRN